MDTSAVVKVEHLIKYYCPVKAVDDISFEVKQGEIFGMLGPNGAGKTTTLEIIEGLRPADSGHVRVMGLDIAREPVEVKQKIGIQLQAPSLLPLLNVEEMLETFAGLYRRHVPADYLLDLLSLKESRKVLVKNLSGGQQQRLSVAMALVNDPEITFLDKPTTGLDPQARRGLWTVIEQMRDKGKTVFLTTHYMEEAERLCHRVAIMDHGKIIALDSPQGLVRSYSTEKAVHFEMEPLPREDVLRRCPAVTRVTVDGTEVVIFSSDVPATLSALLQATEDGKLPGRLRELRIREATLEDVFIKLTGRRIRE